MQTCEPFIILACCACTIQVSPTKHGLPQHQCNAPVDSRGAADGSFLCWAGCCGRPLSVGWRLVMAWGGGSGGGGSTLVAAVVDPITLLHTNCSAPWKHLSLLFIAKSAEAILHLQCVLNQLCLPSSRQV